MNCKQVQKHVNDYQSGDLDRVLREMIDHHLAKCAECRRMFEKEQSVSRFLKTGSVSSVKDSVVKDVLKKVEAIDRESTIEIRSGHDRFMESRMKWLMIAAILLGIGMIGLLVIPFDSRMDQHSIGGMSGPGFTWLGDVPMEDPMESRWRDSNLSGDERMRVQEQEADPTTDQRGSSGRITHVLNLDNTVENTMETGDENP